MGRRWQTIEVQLVGGAHLDLEHPAGRAMICPTGTTFWQLALAIDRAFARWDMSHARMFELDDAMQVVADDWADELASDPWGPIQRTASMGDRVKQRLAVGDRFTYVYDLGDDWRHECVITGLDDPEETLGIVPQEPLAYWGWGAIPDQYGRRWSGDDGESEPPVRPVPQLPGIAVGAPVDMEAWRAAAHARSVERMREALLGTDPEPVLQRVGASLLSVLYELGPKAEVLEPIALSILTRLRFRGWVGDALLSDQLLAALRGEALSGTPLAVRLDSLVDDAASTGPYGSAAGCYLNTRTGESVAAFMADDGDGGFDSDVDAEDRVNVEGAEWVYVRLERPEWQDMEAFAESREGNEREALERAIHGTGAFKRFRAAVDALDLWGEWQARADELQWGELREELRDRGIVPV